jgi:hypothetical protein
MWNKQIRLKNNKQIVVRHGNICTTEESFDVLICSAFKGDYLAIEGTLIGSLEQNKGISVEELAENPFLDYRENHGCWVSETVESNIHRIGCIELLEYGQLGNQALVQATILKEMFASVSFLLKQIDEAGAVLHRVALPVLGSGNQGIEYCYIIPPLINQCMRALDQITQLEELVFYELDENKADKLYNGLVKALDQTRISKEVFISYSSAQRKLADAMKSFLEAHEVSCWMAPYSIPSGSSYQAEIPAALNNTSAVVLLLSEDSEKSRWVQKEVGATIGARHSLIPYMDYQYEHTQQFNFLLDGEQIFEAWAIEDEASRYQALLEELSQKLGKDIRTDKSDVPKKESAPSSSNDSLIHELKLLNQTLKIGFTGIFLLKLLELLVKLFVSKRKSP